MADTGKMGNLYREYKEEQLERDIKRCKTFAVVTGTIATLSSLVVAGNIALGNGLEVLQAGGTTAAMAACSFGYSRQKSIYKKELKELKDSEQAPKSFARERLATLKSELKINQTWLGMDCLVAGSFYTSALGHILEIISMPGQPQMITGIVGAALSALAGTMYLDLLKNHRQVIKSNLAETASLEKLIELEEQKKSQNASMPELIVADGVIEVDIQIEDQPKILQLEQSSFMK